MVVVVVLVEDKDEDEDEMGRDVMSCAVEVSWGFLAPDSSNSLTLRLDSTSSPQRRRRRLQTDWPPKSRLAVVCLSDERQMSRWTAL